MVKKSTEGNLDKEGRDNRANQLNPNNPAYHSSRGGGPVARATSEEAARNNRANQLNPSHEAHKKSRGNDDNT